MFYNHTYAAGRKKLEKELDQLTPGESEKLSHMEKLLANRAIDQIERKLRLERPRVVYKICQNSPALKSICEQENAPHTQSWSTFLQKANYPGFKISSVDNQETITILNQYLGAYFLTHYKELEDKAQLAALVNLDKACDFGMFDALKKRIELNQKKLKNLATDLQDLRLAKMILLNDVARIGNLYWSIGYLHGAFITLDLGNFYTNLDTEESIAMGRKFHEISCKHFMAAKKLAMDEHCETNERIINTVCGKDMLTVFGFADWNTAETFVTTHLSPAAGENK